MTGDLEAVLKRQGIIRSPAEFQAASAVDVQDSERPDSPSPPNVGSVKLTRSPNLSRFVSLSEEEV